MIASYAVALFCFSSSAFAGAQESSLLTNSLEYLKKDQLNIDELQKPATFTPPSADEMPLKESFLGYFIAMCKNVPDSDMNGNSIFNANNYDEWKKFIPAVRDKMAKPRRSDIRWDVMSAKLNAAIKEYEKKLNPDVLKQSLQEIDSLWAEFVKYRNQLIAIKHRAKDKNKSLFSSLFGKTIVTQDNIAKLDGIYSTYSHKVSFLKNLPLIVAKLKYIRPWIESK